jgi:hypothetical protein
LAQVPPFVPTTELGLALTVFQVNSTGSFRIGVSNVSQRPIGDFVINWIALRA